MLNSNILTRPYIYGRWLNGGTTINFVFKVDAIYGANVRIPILVGGNMGGGNFLYMHNMTYITNDLSSISGNGIISHSSYPGIRANLHEGIGNYYRIQFTAPNGLGTHVFFIIPVGGVSLVNSW